MSPICSASAFTASLASPERLLHFKKLKFPRLGRVSLTLCLPASLMIASLSLVTESNSTFRTEVRIAGGGQARLLRWNLNLRGYEKPLLCNILSRFGMICTNRACRHESAFVNHVWSGFESVVQRRFQCRDCAADLTPGVATIRGLACAYC